MICRNVKGKEEAWQSCFWHFSQRIVSCLNVRGNAGRPVYRSGFFLGKTIVSGSHCQTIWSHCQTIKSDTRVICHCDCLSCVLLYHFGIQELCLSFATMTSRLVRFPNSLPQVGRGIWLPNLNLPSRFQVIHSEVDSVRLCFHPFLILFSRVLFSTIQFWLTCVVDWYDIV